MSDLFDVSSKTALVTGGSRGIGLMIARGLVDAGANVIVSSRKGADVRAAAQHSPRTATARRLRPTCPRPRAPAPSPPPSASASPRSTSSSTTPAPAGARRWRSSPQAAGTRSHTPTSRVSSISPSHFCPRCAPPPAPPIPRAWSTSARSTDCARRRWRTTATAPARPPYTCSRATSPSASHPSTSPSTPSPPDRSRAR